MKKSEWKKRIIEACKANGTYRDSFSAVINTLAEILERRDEVNALYVKSGSKPIREYTNKFGATNLTKHPLIVLWDDLNKSALAYWRDLGLTPAGLKKIDDAAFKAKKGGGLEEAIKRLGG